MLNYFLIPDYFKFPAVRVIFTKKSDNLWAPEQSDCKIIKSDIHKKLKDPEIVPHGTRMFYKFEI